MTNSHSTQFATTALCHVADGGASGGARSRETAKTTKLLFRIQPNTKNVRGLRGFAVFVTRGAPPSAT
jgi:hypothetical protein